MSIRSRVISSMEEEQAARERRDRILEGAAGILEASPADLDAEFLANPLRDRQPFWKHLRWSGLLTTVGLNVLLDSGTLLGTNKPVTVPTEDALAVAGWATRTYAPSILKELATTTLHRTYEQLIPRYVKPGDDVFEARFSRDLLKAGPEIVMVARAVASNRKQTGVAAELSARRDTALHIATRVMPYPSIAQNTAVFTVEEGVLFIKWFLHQRRIRDAAKRVEAARSGALSPAQGQTAAQELEVLRTSRTAPALLRDTLTNALKAVTSVVVECSLSGLLTLVTPSWGARAGQMAGNLVGWTLLSADLLADLITV